MPFRDIVSIELLDYLKSCPKAVTNWISRDREKLSHIESTCEAASDSGDIFLVYTRQNKILSDDFSCGIKWSTPDREWAVLARYNGSSHVHTNRLDGEKVIQKCHIHCITVEAVQRGWSYENHAVASDSYVTLDEAKLLLAQDFNVRGLVPKVNQLNLWR